MKKTLRILGVVLAAVLLLTSFAACTKKEEVKIASAADLVGKKIGTQEGTTGADYVEEEIEGSECVKFKKAVDAAIDLANGKLDAVVLDAGPASRIVAQNDKLMIIDTPLTEEEYAVAVRKGDKALLDSINATIARVKQEGLYDKFKAAFPTDEDAVPVPLSERAPTAFPSNIIMGTNAEFEPFEFNKDGKIVGFDVEMAHEIANDLGKNLKIEDMSFGSLINALVGGKIDMILAGMTDNEERRQNVDFSDSYFKASQVIIIRKTSAV